MGAMTDGTIKSGYSIGLLKGDYVGGITAMHMVISLNYVSIKFK